MDILGALEAMVDAVGNDPALIDTSEFDIKRWQQLFNLSATDARAAIEAYRNDMSRTVITDDHWSLISEAKEAEGFDKEAYAYSLEKQKQPTTASRENNVSRSRGTYIVQADGRVSSPGVVQSILGLSHAPDMCSGQGEHGAAAFVKLKCHDKDTLVAWLAVNHPLFRPTIVRLSKAAKELSPQCLAPYLGTDMTLPQHRPSTSCFEPRPRQNEYPVWYFFYGRLADADTLQHLLNPDQRPTLQPAKVYGARLKSWQGKYRAVVDGNAEDVVVGHAFLVENSEQEDTLCFFETDMYEVVRCNIHMEGGSQPGLIFRFDGSILT
ncbi:hypothetical protein PMZ80_008990 [Knufia obscura]|uniref:Gamma-glutamylcyclotransferase AIG2-like domain-containing protein n=2 Tax=Knufia TaxID=430999 RepID=A0AAN8EGI3_9EURO|nr:hypothetical protein PMZ80_008990 [Knufia obscura]KAK5955053.1 hypothetical protein OHC33_003732 [Knufia fluminis]